MQFTVTNSAGRAVRVEGANWIVAMGKAVSFFEVDPDQIVQWKVTPEEDDRIRIEDHSGAGWVIRGMAPSVEVVPVGKREVFTSLLPEDIDEGHDPRDPDQIPTVPPLEKLRMPRSVLSSPPEPVFDEDNLAEKLFDLSMDLVGMPPKEACQAALELVMQHVPCEAGTVLKGTVHDRGLQYLAVEGPFADQLMGRRLPFGQGLGGLAHDLGVPIKVDERSVADPDRPEPIVVKLGYAVRATLCVPVRSDDAVYGVIELYNPKDGPFTPADVETIDQIGTTLASALSTETLVPGRKRAARS